MMLPRELLRHERTLLGAVDSYLKALVRVRPQLAGNYGDCLETVTARWIADYHANELDALSGAWLRAYLATAEQPALAERALRDFLRWAVREELIEQSPLA